MPACGGAGARRVSERRCAAASPDDAGFRIGRFSRYSTRVQSSAGEAGDGGRTGVSERDRAAGSAVRRGYAARAICSWTEDPTLASANGQAVPKMPSITPTKTSTERWAARVTGTAARRALGRAGRLSPQGVASRDGARTQAAGIGIGRRQVAVLQAGLGYRLVRRLSIRSDCGPIAVRLRRPIGSGPIRRDQYPRASRCPRSAPRSDTTVTTRCRAA